MKKERSTDIAYYLTLFRLKGHTTWHAYLSRDYDGFKRNVETNNQNVTETRVIKIDRLQGSILPMP